VPANTSAPNDDGAKADSVKIATLGTLAMPVDQHTAKTSVTTAAKRAQMRHVIRRRRIARARLVVPQKPAGQPVAAQPAPAPFFVTSQPGG
jgi:hypothetical protein